MHGTRRETTDDERARIIASYIAGTTISTISSVLGIGLSAVYAVIRVYVQEDRQSKKRRGGPVAKKLSSEHCDQIRAWVDADCSVSLSRLKERCARELSVQVSEKTIDRCLHVFHYTLKRVHCIPERRNSPETIEIRAEYARTFMDLMSTIDERRFFFLDEVLSCRGVN